MVLRFDVFTVARFTCTEDYRHKSISLRNIHSSFAFSDDFQLQYAEHDTKFKKTWRRFSLQHLSILWSVVLWKASIENLFFNSFSLHAVHAFEITSFQMKHTVLY